MRCILFDLVLMGVQMPFMDGIEATGMTRHKEKDTGLHDSNVPS